MANKTIAAATTDGDFAPVVTLAQTGMASDAELAAHEADTTNVHGISDTSALLDTGDIGSTVEAAGTAAAAVAAHAAAADPHGDRAYATGLVDDLSGVSNASTARTNLGLGTAAVADSDDFDAAGTAAAAVAAHESDTTNVHGIADTSALLNSADIGVSVQAHSAVLDATTASFTTADESKLDGIEAGADVTDVTNVAAAGAVMGSLVDAKGDLLVGTAADTVGRLAVGTDGQVLTADAASAGGVKWAAAAGGSTPDLQPTFTTHTDTWSFLPGVARLNALGNYTFGSDRWVVSQICIPAYDLTITQAQVYINTGVASSYIRPLIATADEDWQPQSIVWQTSFDSSSSGRKTETGLSVALSAGTRYLVLVRADNGGVAVKYTYLDRVTGGGPTFVESAEANTHWGSFTSTVSTGAWSEPLPALIGMQSVSNFADFLGTVWFKYAAS